jgi:hypothetical protein
MAVLGFLLLVTWLALRPLPLPAPAGTGSPAGEVSAGRALGYLANISLRPHPVGSADHDRVREYLVRQLAGLGFETRVQEATATRVLQVGAVRNVWAGRMQNVLGRKRGSGSSGAVLLVTHYDSVPSSPGASDSGAAVAAILEAVRALAASGPLRNDLIVLFSDGEETGCLGARAFAESDPWAADIRAVLNFDARGTRGPVLMFETGPDNGWLVGQLAGTQYPVSSSLAATVYRYMPNGTDFTVFRDRGMAGLNFAFLHGPIPYHSASDRIERLDRGTLQQLGATILDLARRLGSADLRQRPRGDAVFFNGLGYGLIVYPTSWALPFSLATAAVLAGVVVLGFRRRRLTRAGIARGALVFLLVLVAVLATGLLAVWFVLRADPSFRWLTQGTAYDSNLHFAGFALLALAAASAVYASFRRRVSLEDAAVGALLVESVLGLLAAAFVPGGSYLLTWPLLATIAGMGVWLLDARREPASPGAVAALLVGALPALLLMVPWISLLFVGLSVYLAWAVGIFEVLLAGLLVPHLYLLTQRRRWLLPSAAALLASGCLVSAAVTADFDREHPRPDSAFYVLDAATGQAHWASLDDRPDEWTSQFLGTSPEQGTLTPFTGARQRRYLLAAAPATPLAPPEAVLLGEEATPEGGRRLRLRVRSGRPAGAVRIDFSRRPDLATLTVDGQPVKTEGGEPGAVDRLLYFGPPAAGFEVALTAADRNPVELNLVEYSLELPPLSFRPRPPSLIPKTAMYSDVTLIRRSFKF